MIKLHKLDPVPFFVSHKVGIESLAVLIRSSDGLICDKRKKMWLPDNLFIVKVRVGQRGLMVKSVKTIHLKNLNVSSSL